MAPLFTKTMATDVMGIRRAVNVLIKNEHNFACITGEPGYWIISTNNAGYECLKEEGLVND